MKYFVESRGLHYFVIDGDHQTVAGGPSSEKKMQHLADKLNKRNDDDGLNKDDWELKKARNETEVYPLQQAGFEPFAVDNGIIYFKRQVK